MKRNRKKQPFPPFLRRSRHLKRICKTPATVFILPGCIALVPGGTLYYAMSNLLSQNRELALENFLVTLTVGIAIGGGIIASSLLRVTVQAISRKLKSKKV